MVANHQRFAAPDEIARWRTFALIDGWAISGSFATEEGEVRLFDAPIVDGTFADMPLRCGGLIQPEKENQNGTGSMPELWRL